MKRIEIGTRVKFLNDVGGGLVKAFKDDRFAVVENDEGFELPILITDLIVDEVSSYGVDDEGFISQKPVAPPHKPEEKKTQISFEEKKYEAFKGEVLIAIVPQNDQLLHVSDFSLYIVNDTNYYCNYTISYKDASVSTHMQSGTIEANTKLEIQSFSQTDIGQIKDFYLQGIFFKHGLTGVLKPLDLKFSIEDISFYKSQFFHENDFFHSKAIVLKKEEEVDLQEAIAKLKASDLSKIAKIKETQKKKEETKSPKTQESLEEIDLHIEQLVERSSSMSNGEIINIQLSRFETALETARRSNTQKIVFIHGVGNGKLKSELRKKLDKEYAKLRYQDASFKEYGYGATMVILR